MARKLYLIFCALALLTQTIRCQCLGNPYNGPIPGPGCMPEMGYGGPGFVGNNFGPELPFNGPGCYNPSFGNEVGFGGPGPYNPGFGNDFGLPGPGFLNPGFGGDFGCGGPAPFNPGFVPDIGYPGPSFGPEFGVPNCNGPIIGPGGPHIGPGFGDIGFGGFPNPGLIPEVGLGPGFIGPNIPGPCPNLPCGPNFAPNIALVPNFAPNIGPTPNFAPNIGPVPSFAPPCPFNVDVPLGMPFPNVPQIAPVIEPSGLSAPIRMPPTGMSIYSDDLIIEGPVVVTGRMPFLGAVTMEGAFSSAGAGAVSYNCVDNVAGIVEGPATATVAPSFGFAPALPIGLPYGGFSGPGIGCNNRVY